MKITGTIEKISSSSDNGFLKATVIPNDGGKKITVVGVIKDAKPGAKVTLTGDWQTWRNETQFKISSAKVSIDPNAVSATKFLIDFIKGFGPKLAVTTVETLGSNLNKYMADEDRLTDVKGISKVKASEFVSQFIEVGKYYSIYRLTGGEVTKGQVIKMFEKHGDKTQMIIKRNPYALLKTIKGIGFHKIDKIALGAGIRFNSDERIEAAILATLQDGSQKNGHCFLYEEELLNGALELLLSPTSMKSLFYTDVLHTAVPSDLEDWQNSNLSDLVTNKPRTIANMIKAWDTDNRSSMRSYIKKYALSDEDIETLNVYTGYRHTLKNKVMSILYTTACYLDNVPIRKDDSNDRDVLDVLTEQRHLDDMIIADTNAHNMHRYYERSNYLYEQIIAEDMVDLSRSVPSIVIDDDMVGDAISEFEASTGMSLAHEQKLAVKMALQSRVSILTGGPGRGKTSITRAIINGWKANGGNVLLLAPTGRAAQRLSEATGASAATIHRILHKKNAMNLKEYTKAGNKTLVIVDESSMIEMKLAANTLHAFSNCGLLFIGDADQLPCVGVGEFFEQIIASEKIPCTKLIECYRSSGSISANSDVINRGGRLNELTQDHMFKISYSDDPEAVQKKILAAYKEARMIYSPKDICIVTPMRQNGKTSAQTLNKLIQEEFNPKTPLTNEFRSGSILFREGDRVMQLKNNYNLKGVKNLIEVDGVFNGETGDIIQIQRDYIKVRFDDGKEVYYSTLDLGQLSLAYASTVHKAQGSEYPCLITAYTKGDYLLLCRRILYTAVSRGKKKVYLLGDYGSIQRAASNSYYAVRNSSLSERIQVLSA